jgi:FtsP/CotA-like multicopper oxidase with cupredoxin domain
MRQFKKLGPISVLVALAIGSICFFTMRTLAVNLAKAVSKKGPVGAASQAPGANAHLPVIAASLSTVEDDEKALWLTIRPSRFEPSEFTVPAGEYFVVIQNATGLPQFGFRVDQENGGQLLDVHLPLRTRYWKNTITLQPGRFTVTETDHPEWHCLITVTAQ